MRSFLKKFVLPVSIIMFVAAAAVLVYLYHIPYGKTYTFHDEYLGYNKMDIALTLKDGENYVMDITTTSGEQSQTQTTRGKYDIRNGVIYHLSTEEGIAEERIGLVDYFTLNVIIDNPLAETGTLEIALTNKTGIEYRNIAYVIMVVGAVILTLGAIGLAMSKKPVSQPKQVHHFQPEDETNNTPLV